MQTPHTHRNTHIPHSDWSKQVEGNLSKNKELTETQSQKIEIISKVGDGKLEVIVNCSQE